jgi:hypothetical protein
MADVIVLNPEVLPDLDGRDLQARQFRERIRATAGSPAARWLAGRPNSRKSNVCALRRTLWTFYQMKGNPIQLSQINEEDTIFYPWHEISRSPK